MVKLSCLLVAIPWIALAGATVTDVTVGAMDPRFGTARVAYKVVTDDENSSPCDLRAVVVDRLSKRVLCAATLEGLPAEPLAAGTHAARWNVLADVPNLPAGRAELRMSVVERPPVSEGETVPVEAGMPSAKEETEPMQPPLEVSEKQDGQRRLEERAEWAPSRPAPLVVPLADLPPGAPPYLVIDLSAGPQADHYPVYPLSEPPNGVWSDEFKTTKLVLRRIEPGSFLMGWRATDCPGAEERLRRVTLTRPFYIGVFPVTQGQWRMITGRNPSRFLGDNRPVEGLSYDTLRGREKGAQWPNSRDVDESSVIGMLRRKTGLGALDLPTEARWEYACRAGTTTALNNGKNVKDRERDPVFDEVGRYWFNGGQTLGTPVVGSFKPNAWGLFDMHGCVWEWCLDWLTEDLGIDDVVDPRGPSYGQERINRGGAWNYSASGGSSASRGRKSPSHDHDFGFGVRFAVGIP